MNEKEYVVKIGNGYFAGYDEIEARVIFDDLPGFLIFRKVFNNIEQAEEVAEHIGGEVEEL